MTSNNMSGNAPVEGAPELAGGSESPQSVGKADLGSLQAELDFMAALSDVPLDIVLGPISTIPENEIEEKFTARNLYLAGMHIHDGYHRDIVYEPGYGVLIMYPMGPHEWISEEGKIGEIGPIHPPEGVEMEEDQAYLLLEKAVVKMKEYIEDLRKGEREPA